MHRWLSRQSDGWVNAIAIAASFVTYFSMYAFRKPFTAAGYEGSSVGLVGGDVEQKTLFVISQIIGYAISKYVGVRVCSESRRSQRYGMLVGLILAAEAALVLFGLAPESSPLLKAAAIFANGLPLGMVWGMVVLYLEGRRASEMLLTGLSCAYIVASGVVKDIGRALLEGIPIPLPAPEAWGWALPNPYPALSEYWMPAATGALFLPLFLISAWVLEQLPEPSAEDQAERTKREPMDSAQRRRFVSRYALAISMALGVYFALTAFRDYRDNYAVELFTLLEYDYESNKTIVSRAELLVAFGVMAILSQLYRVHSNRLGLAATYGVMAGGLLLVGGSTALLETGRIDGFWWYTLTGLGAYLAYVPFGSVLFDRVIASTGFAGTAVFGIYLADAIGYTGSVVYQLSGDLALPGWDRLALIKGLSYFLAVGGAVALAISCASFLLKSPSPELRDN